MTLVGFFCLFNSVGACGVWDSIEMIYDMQMIHDCSDSKCRTSLLQMTNVL
jgi:hypothetical protein